MPLWQLSEIPLTPDAATPLLGCGHFFINALCIRVRGRYGAARLIGLDALQNKDSG